MIDCAQLQIMLCQACRPLRTAPTALPSSYCTNPLIDHGDGSAESRVCRQTAVKRQAETVRPRDLRINCCSITGCGGETCLWDLGKRCEMCSVRVLVQRIFVNSHGLPTVAAGRCYGPYLAQRTLGGIGGSPGHIANDRCSPRTRRCGRVPGQPGLARV
jgi:hypothetical protein